MPIITQRQLNKLLKTPREKPLNVCRCETCRAICWSSHRHDWVPCKCGHGSPTSIYIDGGDDYVRMGFGVRAKYSWWDAQTERWKLAKECS